MTSCENFIDLISARLDGMTSQTEERALDEHLSLCPECRGLERRLQAIHAAFPELEEFPAPAELCANVMAEIRNEKKPVPLLRRPGFRVLAGMAACAALCLGLYRGQMRPANPGLELVDLHAQGEARSMSRTVLLAAVPEAVAGIMEDAEDDVVWSNGSCTLTGAQVKLLLERPDVTVVDCPELPLEAEGSYLVVLTQENGEMP